MSNRQLYDTNQELIVQRCGNGVHLINPEKGSNSYAINSIRNLFCSPLNVFFLDAQHIIKNLNESTIKNAGFVSAQSAIGNTVAIAANKKSAEFEFAHEKEVLLTNRMILKEEHYTKLDGTDSHFLNIKFAWYNQYNKIIGIFGLAFATNSETLSNSSLGFLSQSLTFLFDSGLLSNTHQTNPIKSLDDILPGKTFGSIYVSKRQAEILKYLILGKTAKQIGKTLNLSSRTIEFYLSNIKKKFKVNSKSELIGKIMDHYLK